MHVCNQQIALLGIYYLLFDACGIEDGALFLWDLFHIDLKETPVIIRPTRY